MQTIDELPELTKDELLAIWKKLPTRHPPPTAARVLLREVAYRLQEQRSGKLDKSTSVSIRRHMTVFAESLVKGRPSPVIKTPQRVVLEHGSVLKRTWEGRELVVQVLGRREFIFEGKKYRSLSAIAKEVTGQHISGPLFFGVKEVNHA